MSEAPAWVSIDHVQRLHDRTIETIGGAAGLRDESLLASAVARPLNLHSYGEESDIFQLAACYAEGIAKNHPFVDGNKRTAFLSADLFLSLNSYSLDPSPVELHADNMVALAEGAMDRDQFAQHLSDHSVFVERRK